jgi:hypothetical protein
MHDQNFPPVADCSESSQATSSCRLITQRCLQRRTRTHVQWSLAGTVLNGDRDLQSATERIFRRGAVLAPQPTATEDPPYWYYIYSRSLYIGSIETCPIAFRAQVVVATKIHNRGAGQAFASTSMQQAAEWFVSSQFLTKGSRRMRTMTSDVS